MNLKMIISALKKPDKSKSGLAAAMGVPNSAITELLAGRRDIKTREVEKITKYLQLNEVPLMGRVGAGGDIEPELEQDTLTAIELPFAVPDEMLAFEIDGESMLPRHDPGDVIVVWKEQRRPMTSFYGQVAAVRTKDGKRYLKRIERGKTAAFVNLASINASRSAIENVKLEWIGEIHLIMPRDQVRRIERNEMVRARRAEKAHRDAATLELPLRKRQ